MQQELQQIIGAGDIGIFPGLVDMPIEGLSVVSLIIAVLIIIAMCISHRAFWPSLLVGVVMALGSNQIVFSEQHRNSLIREVSWLYVVEKLFWYWLPILVALTIRVIQKSRGNIRKE